MKKSILLITILAFFSCQKEEYAFDEGKSQIVVEGWIDEGDVARVILSRSSPLSEMIDSSNFLKYAIRSAMLIVSDDTGSDTLRLTSAAQHIPPFLYVGEKIIGKAGGKYHLSIKHLGQTITAETVIPPSVPINKVRYTRQNPADTIGNLTVEFTHPAGQQNYYQIATLLDGFDKTFIPCLYGNYNSRNFVSPEVSIQVTRGITIFPVTNFDACFKDGDHIHVRLRTMSKEGFDFWNVWQYELVNAQNAIFPANRSLKGNINGGVGIWCGYGQHTVRITAR
jgi:hypothetical protein